MPHFVGGKQFMNLLELDWHPPGCDGSSMVLTYGSKLHFLVAHTSQVLALLIASSS